LAFLFSSSSTNAFSTSIRTNTIMTPPPPAPIKVIPSDKLFVSEPDPTWFGNGPNPKKESDPTWTNENWLQSRFHFSFAEYSNTKNSQYGVLRVLNDDLVQPHRGFGTHPHRDMEIITYIVQGKLTHKDTLGTKESLGRGSVQFMTAGSGIRHSEANEGDTPLRFVQSWVVPSSRGLQPNYGSFNAQECHRNMLRQMVSYVEDSTVSTPVKINQDANMYTAELELGTTVNHDIDGSRQAYLVCLEGGISVNGKELNRHDACEVGSGTLAVTATATEETENGPLAHFLLFDMEKVPGSGRADL
jgi:quercetin 2,3-dioxygenase